MTTDRLGGHKAWRTTQSRRRIPRSFPYSRRSQRGRRIVRARQGSPAELSVAGRRFLLAYFTDAAQSAILQRSNVELPACGFVLGMAKKDNTVLASSASIQRRGAPGAPLYFNLPSSRSSTECCACLSCRKSGSLSPVRKSPTQQNVPTEPTPTALKTRSFIVKRSSSRNRSCKIFPIRSLFASSSGAGRPPLGPDERSSAVCRRFSYRRPTRCGKLSSFDRPSLHALATTLANLRRNSPWAIRPISFSRSIRLCHISRGGQLRQRSHCDR